MYIPSPDVEGAVSGVGGAVLGALRPCSALLHCWTYKFKGQKEVTGQERNMSSRTFNNLLFWVTFCVWNPKI